MKLYALACMALLFACKPAAPTVWHTGLQYIYAYDSSRHFDTASTSARYYRPVKIDLFYPTEDSSGTPIIYGDIMDQYEKRMDYQVSADSCKKSSRMIASIFTEYMHLDSVDRLLRYPLTIGLNRTRPAGHFPVIIYAAGMNGSSWENPLLFERLTQKGYVVAAVSSVGLFPGFMSGAEDIKEQVEDILFVKRFLQDSVPFADTRHTGLLSWSLGGTAITKAAMLDTSIQCLLSFDGTETHYYGFDTAWDRQYDQILQLPPYTPEKIRMPYMYLSSGRSGDSNSIYFFPAHINSRDKYFLRFANAIHEDFSCLPYIIQRQQPSIKGPYLQNTADISQLTLSFFDQYLQKQPKANTAALIQDLVKRDSVQYSTLIPSPSAGR
ncbi:hypothetical protein F0L74_24305 [Chitinophaga agrisoli]|uniref:Dienelactone hydrolase n=1 Tax=Chitinophaga agrisoli TaxID=2607653 RepID=A0A5B2VJR0_9BACT|nr:hypothetical protein [Chitinophaga agrisoli]KAA2239331.1 hypothetical protein F0L74_24305 [Chitinophaga agrisoli]